MKQWFYTEQGQQRGPIPENEIVQMFRSGHLRADTLVWTFGLDNWTIAADIKNLVPSDLSPPPIPENVHAPLARQETTHSSPIFLYIPIERLVFMSIISIGLYEAYWIYKNWLYLKQRDGLKIYPFWRAIFGVFFCHGILKSIQNDQQTNALEQATFSAGGLATGWVIFVLLDNLLGRADSLAVNAVGMIIGFLSFLFFIPVQKYINRVNAKIIPTPAYHHWSAGHIVCLVFGILFWLLIMAAFALPE